MLMKLVGNAIINSMNLHNSNSENAFGNSIILETHKLI